MHLEFVHNGIADVQNGTADVVQNGTADVKLDATTTRLPFHPVRAYKYRSGSYRNLPSVNEEDEARKMLQDFYRKDELQKIRLQRMYPRSNSTSARNRHLESKSRNETSEVYTFWFSCNNYNTCIAVTALVACVITTVVIVCFVCLCLQLRFSKTKFSPEEWWRQPAATPLLMIPSLEDDDMNVPKKELVRLRKYLKKYMSINQNLKDKRF